MPVHTTGDSLSPLVTFQTSPVFEMLASLGGIAASWRLPDLTASAQEALGRIFIEDLREFYDDFFSCCSLVELAIDYPDHHDVDGFISYVESMTDSEFAFYALGRWIPKQKFDEVVNPEAVRRLFNESEDREELERTYPRLEWLADITAFKSRLLEIWRRYWEGFLKERIARLEPDWSRSILEKQRILDERGGGALLEHLTTKRELPDPVPVGEPYTQIVVVPICNSERPKTVYYGYGKAHVLYDCERTEEHAREVEAKGEQSLVALKALADENRLKILKLVAQNERFLNGKCIAEKLKLSPSVVSRHLAQLKAADFIREYSPDNRNITYNFNLERVRGLSVDLEAFIKD